MNIDDLYVIYMENAFDQILIFPTKDGAREWARTATRWNDDEIERNIKKVAEHTDGIYHVMNTDRWMMYAPK